MVFNAGGDEVGDLIRFSRVLELGGADMVLGNAWRAAHEVRVLTGKAGGMGK